MIVLPDTFELQVNIVFPIPGRPFMILLPESFVLQVDVNRFQIPCAIIGLLLTLCNFNVVSPTPGYPFTIVYLKPLYFKLMLFQMPDCPFTIALH